MSQPITAYDATNQSSLKDMRAMLDQAFTQAATVEGDEDVEQVEQDHVRIPEFGELLGVDPAVYRQINAALSSSKRHIMFYGPPGTGKTTLARLIAGHLADEWKLITASADWTSQDIIGGYMPLEGGKISFFPGVLLEHFDKPLVIDELNRCDIDKVIGPLFTVLSGQPTTLPYLSDPSDPHSERYRILPEPKAHPAETEFSPSASWRIIATINTVDKASLYQMSYALSRRFAWILVDTPASSLDFLSQWLTQQSLIAEGTVAPASLPLAEVWDAANAARPMGPAPVIDAARYAVSASDGEFDFSMPISGASDVRVPILVDAFLVFFLPMLDGISSQQGHQVLGHIKEALKLTDDGPQMATLKRAVLAACI